MTRSRRIVVALFLLLAVALAVGAALVWESLRPTVIELADPVELLALSADGSSVAASEPKLTWIYTKEAGAHRALDYRFEGFVIPHETPTLAFSSKDDVVYAVDELGRTSAWRRPDGVRVPISNPDVWDAALSPGGDLEATFVRSSGLLIRALPNRTLVREIPKTWSPRGSYRLGFSPSGALVWASGLAFCVGGGGDSLSVWSVRDGRSVFEGKAMRWIETVLDPGDAYVGVEHDRRGVFDLETEHAKYELPAHGPEVAVTRDGELLACGDAEIELHDARSGALVRRYRVREPEHCTALAFSANRERLAAAFGRRIYVWRLRR